MAYLNTLEISIVVHSCEFENYLPKYIILIIVLNQLI